MLTRTTRTGFCLALLALLTLPAIPAVAQEGQTPRPKFTDPNLAPVKAPVIEPLGEDRYRIGELVVDRASREIRLPGVIALNEGPLEYLACAAEGKLYESLLRIDADPYHIHLALLLIGLEPENNLVEQGEATIAGGDRIEIFVSWEAGEKRVSHRAEELLWEPLRKRPMTRTGWAFTGSNFIGDVFEASLQKSIIAVYNDPTAIINNVLPTGADDTAYVPYAKLLPPPETAVEILFRPAKKKKQKKGS